MLRMIPDMLRLNGALHIHSTLSHDGCLTLIQLSHFFKLRAFDFIAVTDHSYDLNADTADRLRRECQDLSDEKLLIIPGIEFRGYSDMDILGFGVTRLCDSHDPGDIIEHIHDCGGVAVWAHPGHRNYKVEAEWLIKLDGAEIWNMIYDSRFGSRARSVRYFFELLKTNPRLKAFCGVDMHKGKNYWRNSTVVTAGKCASPEIMAAFKKGDFEIKSPLVKIDSSADFSQAYMIYLNALSYMIDGARRTRDLITNE